jgi:flagellar hook-length control protein FliK
MVPDIVVKPAAALPVAAEKGTIQPGADGHPVFGEALRAACSESDAQARPSSGHARDSRRCQGDASSPAWWACARPVAKDSATAVDDPQVAEIDETPFDAPINGTTDAAPTEDDGSSAIDSGGALLAIGSQPIVEAQAAAPVLDAGIEIGASEDPGITTASESGGEAFTAEDVVSDSLPQATRSKLPAPSDVEADSARAADATDADRATEVAQSDASADVDRSVDERVETDAAHSAEASPQTTATRKVLDQPSLSSARQPDHKGSGEAAKPTVATETSVAAASSPTSQPSEVGSQTLPPAAAGEGAEPLQATTRDSSPMPADTGRSVLPDSSGSEAGQRQSEHGRSQQDQPELGWRPYVSPQSLAGRTTALSAPGLALLQGSDGILALMPAGAVPSLAQQARIPGDNLDELVQTMRVMVRGKVSEATVRLRPEHLGDVSVAVRVDGKVVTATVIAESAGVREWLQQHEETLRAGLQQQGLTLDRLIVQREARQEQREQPHPEARKSRARRGPGPQPRFEVTA